MSFTIANGKYQLQKLIGEGSYGKVYFSSPYAIKQISMGKNSNCKKLIDNQIKVLRLLINTDNKNIVKLYQVFYENGFIYVVMEKCDSDFSDQTIKYIGKEQNANLIIRQLINGYRELESMKIVHRDLKPSNLLLKKGVLKIADFGLAKCRDHLEMDLFCSAVGTPKYMAPQIFLRQKYSSKCDVWSLGIIYYQLLYGCFPWNGKNQKALIQNIMKQKLLFQRNVIVSYQAQYILQRMLEIYETNRADWNEVYQYFIDFPLEKRRLIPESDIKNLIEIELIQLGFDPIKLKSLFDGNRMQITINEKKILQQFLNMINVQDQQLFLNFLGIHSF